MVAPLVLGAGISAGAGLLGGLLGNRASSREAERSRDWQEHMRATQYQTAVSDLRSAGLNPMLAYTQGGAGTPSGATARQEDPITPALSSAAQAASVMAGVQNTLAQTAVSEAQAKKIEAETKLVLEQVAHEPYKKALTTNQGWIAHLQEARERRTYEHDISRRIAEARLENLKLPEGEATAKFYEMFGSAAPALSSARGLADLIPLFKLLLGRK